MFKHLICSRGNTSLDLLRIDASDSTQDFLCASITKSVVLVEPIDWAAVVEFRNIIPPGVMITSSFLVHLLVHKLSSCFKDTELAHIFSQYHGASDWASS